MADNREPDGDDKVVMLLKAVVLVLLVGGFLWWKGILTFPQQQVSNGQKISRIRFGSDIVANGYENATDADVVNAQRDHEEFIEGMADGTRKVPTFDPSSSPSGETLAPLYAPAPPSDNAAPDQ